MVSNSFDTKVERISLEQVERFTQLDSQVRAQAKLDRKSESVEASRAKAKSSRNESSHQDISLRFHVDPDTQEINVIILDKSTGRVIRTIPPDELAKLLDRELVNKFV